ncbi:MAG: bacteriohemerythrin [Desulfovibrio sp.]
MPIIEWTEDMGVGLDILDEQHKELVLLIDTAYRGIMENADAVKPALDATQLIQDMKSYAQAHFSQEEEEMRRTDYPRTAEHVFMHKEFLRRVSGLERPGIGLDMKVDVFLFLADWLRTHILREDLDFGDYVRALDPASKSSR